MSPGPAALPGTVPLRAAETGSDLAACWPLLHALRPHLASPEEFLSRVTRQVANGYRLLVAWQGDAAAALAGWRVQENLVYGRHLYVDDLVTRPESRGLRLGAQLLAALVMEGRGLGCAKLVLDTALHNTVAQHFYAREGLRHTALRFSVDLN